MITFTHYFHVTVLCVCVSVYLTNVLCLSMPSSATIKGTLVLTKLIIYSVNFTISKKKDLTELKEEQTSFGEAS